MARFDLDGRPVQKPLLFGDEAGAASADLSSFAGKMIQRIRPPVKAHGGKFYLARQIVPIRSSVRARVTEYFEPCAFGASVFLAMPRFEREILGDVNPDVVGLWTVLAREWLAEALAERVGEIPYARPAFDAAKE